MLIFGIHSKKQLKRRNVEGYLGRRRPIAVDLYEECYSLAPVDREFFQEITLDRFISKNATFKRTYLDRFASFDAKILPRMAEMINRKEQPLEFHDIGVSDGRSSISLYLFLKKTFGENFHLTASDFDTFVTLVTISKRGTRVIFDRNNSPLQLVVPPFVFNVVKPPRASRYTVNWLIYKFLNKSILSKAMRILEAQTKKTRTIWFVYKKCKDLTNSEANFTYIWYDILGKPHGKMDVIRIMNVLNPSYFDDKEMKLAIKNIRNSLTEDGILITGSNQDRGSDVDGGLYQKRGNTFFPVIETGRGSPIRELLCTSKPIPHGM